MWYFKGIKSRYKGEDILIGSKKLMLKNGITINEEDEQKLLDLGDMVIFVAVVFFLAVAVLVDEVLVVAFLVVVVLVAEATLPVISTFSWPFHELGLNK